MEKPKLSYRFLRGAVRLFTPRVQTFWEEPFGGEPSVFLCNHARAMGPIDMCVYFPLRDGIRLWMNDSVLHPSLVPAYVRQDYWYKPGTWRARILNCFVPYLAALVLPAVLRNAPYIPVYHDMRVVKTFRASIDALRQGYSVVIFPEQPAGYHEREEQLNSGFLLIARMAYQKMGLALRFYPVHIDQAARRIDVRAPLCYDPTAPLSDQQPAIMSALQELI